MQPTDPEPNHDTPLPSTLRFVLVMAAAFFSGWLVLFFVLKARV